MPAKTLYAIDKVDIDLCAGRFRSKIFVNISEISTIEKMPDNYPVFFKQGTYRFSMKNGDKFYADISDPDLKSLLEI